MTDVAARLAGIRERIEAACRRAGRDPSEVTLVGASKQQPLERLRSAYDAGLRTLGENRVQEAIGKAEALPDDIDWHLIGPLQTNKAKKALELFSTVHSLDRRKLARVLDREAGKLDRRLPCFLEVNLGEEESKHGFLPRDLEERADALLDHRSLDLVGLMAIPPFEEDLEAARGWFRRLRELRDRLAARPAWKGFPGLLSMGMSHDFEVAIEEGATHVRLGTVLFGERESP